MYDGAQQVQVVRELVDEESVEVNEARAAVDIQNGIGITERALPQRKRILVEVQLRLRSPSFGQLAVGCRVEAWHLRAV